MVFRNVGLFCIIQPNQKLNFYSRTHFPSWVINGQWYNTMICSLLNGSSFEDYVTSARQDKYNLMCSIEAHEVYHPTINYDSSSGGGRPLTFNSKKDVVVSLGLTLNSVDSWLKPLK